MINETINDCEQQLVKLQTKWDGHTCSSCSHSDYDAIKTQKDNLQSQITNLTQEKNGLQTERDHYKAQISGQTAFDKIKQNLIKQIITDSGLNCENSLGQI